MDKFKRLVEFEDSMESFTAKYRIPPIVGMRYAAQGEWVDARKIGEVVIPIVGTRFLCGPLTFLGSHNKGPSQYDL